MHQFARMTLKNYPIWVAWTRTYYTQDWESETQDKEVAGLLILEISEGRLPLTALYYI